MVGIVSLLVVVCCSDYFTGGPTPKEEPAGVLAQARRSALRATRPRRGAKT